MPMQDYARPECAPASEFNQTLLDKYFAQLVKQPTPKCVEELAMELNVAFDEASKSQSLLTFKGACRSHKIHKLIMQDPYSRRAFEKPRGYAGDAVMLDYIYRPQQFDIPPVGKAVHDATTRLPSAQSILWRRNFIRSLISETIADNKSAKIFSIASGHMRELDDLHVGKDVSFWAIDHDKKSLSECRSSYGHIKLNTIHKPVSFLLGEQKEREFDLVYSAGLFDYLSDRFAIKLIKNLYDRLRSGGTLLIINFAPNNQGRGFMAGMMDWDLIYRDQAELLRLVKQAIPAVEPVTLKDSLGQVVYSALEKCEDTAS
jgi:extracellular factor (EF) 3-hydroxypalmitic acid methyl ester biosynthesis protein